jgi:hypothetical protein
MVLGLKGDKMKTNTPLLIALLSLSVLTASCKQSGSSSSAEFSSVSSTSATLDPLGSMSTVSCKTDAAPLDPSTLSIEGAKGAQAGAPVVFRLNQDINCSSSQKVVWQTVGGAEVETQSSQMQSVFAKAGEYLVTAKIIDESASAPVKPVELAMKTTVVESQAAISGPIVVTAGEDANFSLVLPSGVAIQSASWDFGDGSNAVSSLDNVTHSFDNPGAYKVTVTLRDSNNLVSTLTSNITAIDFYDGLECVSETAISGASTGTVGTPITLALFLPSCLAQFVTNVTWAFGDGTTGSNATVQHTYLTPGTFDAVVTVYTRVTAGALLTIHYPVRIDLAEVSLPPTPTPAPSATPLPTPTPNPRACTSEGQTREVLGLTFSEESTCGLNGHRSATYRTVIIETCRPDDEGNDVWQETSRRKDLLSETPCGGQSCRLSDGSLLNDGDERVGLVIGEVTETLSCAYGEQGIVSIYEQLADQSCTNGQLSTRNTRQGTIKTPGACPTYAWVATDSWTTCSADCGGKQSRLFECRNNKGETAPDERCTGARPSEERACDRNPEAVRRVEMTKTQEEANSSEICPKNQIGVVVKTRDVTTTKTYACIDHQVQLESTKVDNSAWISESYCRNFVAMRCSADSLSPTDANGRYKWMVKCQDQLPIIKDFLEKFDAVRIERYQGQNIQLDEGEKADKGASVWSLDSSGRQLYPTFQDRAFTPAKTWVAPKKESAACTMPSTAFVAAVCVSSCATPEQEILAEAKANLKLKYVPFIDALTQDFKKVATLKPGASMRSTDVLRTEVDQWVTELVDTDHVILVFKMKSGRLLKLTPNHPVVTAEGAVKEAGSFRVGESLVQLGGKLDEIVSITETKYFGKVYNIFVKSSELEKNVVVTNGYLNGTAMFQNEGTKFLNTVILRDRLTRGVFEK